EISRSDRRAATRAEPPRRSEKQSAFPEANHVRGRRTGESSHAPERRERVSCRSRGHRGGCAPGRPATGSGLAHAGGVDPELLEAVAERVARHPEETGGAGLAAAAPPEGLDEERALEVLEVDASLRDLDAQLTVRCDLDARCLCGKRWEREGARVDLVAVAEQDRAIERVPELAHVARPRIAPDQRLRLGREASRGRAVTAGDLRHEPSGEQRDVVAARPERRDVEPGDAQAEVEVLAERAGAHHLL